MNRPEVKQKSYTMSIDTVKEMLVMGVSKLVWVCQECVGRRWMFPPGER